MSNQDIAERLRELADEIESGDSNDLPEYDGYQMVEEVDHSLNGVNIYRDSAGHYWFEPATGFGVFCSGDRHNEFLNTITDDD